MLLLVVFGCDQTADVATPRSPPGLDGTWIAEIVREPARFTALVDGEAREGWIALHRNDWLAAAAAGGVPSKRALEELATFHTVLADLSDDAWLTLGRTWEARGTLPTDSVFPRLVRLAATDAADDVLVKHWEAVPAAPAPPALTTREQLHAKLLAADADIEALRPEIEALRGDAKVPLFTESAKSVERSFYDPIVHRTLASTYRRCAERLSAAATPLEASLFSGGPFDALGVSFPTSAEDDAESCRTAVRALDAVMDPWKVQLGTTASEQGRELLHELRLVEGLRARILSAQAVAALEADRPRCALAYAEMALDHESPRALGPINAPTLYAVMASADLRTGHTREALDALQVLTTPFPETVALDETVGDLAVLLGIDRAGDSREN